jgi:transcriptional regulator with GAF, ATPase, and Fis domain
LNPTVYRRKAILTRIRQALDAFYLLQKIDWEYDARATLEKILGLALGEVEFDEGRQIERGLIILESEEGGKLEVHAGWKIDDQELTFSRTVVQNTLSTGESVLCENAKDDPRFMQAESIKNLETLSLISVPLCIEGRMLGALYIESKSPRNLFNSADLEFLEEFAGTICPYIKTALTHQGHLKAIRRLQEEVAARYRFGNLIGRSPVMRSVFELVRIACGVDRTVLITGESGCGKELIARAIHHNGLRCTRAFVVVDCSSLAEHLLESELFGHRKGAFTGAFSDKVGAFEEADGGTIFLDEISDASKPLQQKFRRVLQEGEIRRVGDNVVRKVDVRVICATNKELPVMVEKGEFMRDLFFRINKFPIHLPPLRERRQDIPPLVEHFLQEAARQGGKEEKRMHPEALEILARRDWSDNNARELRNTVELAVDFCPGAEIAPGVILRVLRVQAGAAGRPPGTTGELSPEAPVGSRAEAASRGEIVTVHREGLQRIFDDALADTPSEEGRSPYYRVQLEASARAILEGLRRTAWKVRPAAKLLGISPTKLRNDLKEYIEGAIARHEGSIKGAAATLDVPEDVLRRKAADLGLEDIVGGGTQ